MHLEMNSQLIFCTHDAATTPLVYNPSFKNFGSVVALLQGNFEKIMNLGNIWVKPRRFVSIRKKISLAFWRFFLFTYTCQRFFLSFI